MEEIRKGYWKKYGPKPKRSSSPNRRRPKLPKGLHACTGLPAQNCTEAKVCYFQPKARQGKGRCMTRSGKAVVDSFNIPGRASVLKAINHPHQWNLESNMDFDVMSGGIGSVFGTLAKTVKVAVKEAGTKVGEVGSIVKARAQDLAYGV